MEIETTEPDKECSELWRLKVGLILDNFDYLAQLNNEERCSWLGVTNNSRLVRPVNRVEADQQRWLHSNGYIKA